MGLRKVGHFYRKENTLLNVCSQRRLSFHHHPHAIFGRVLTAAEDGESMWLSLLMGQKGSKKRLIQTLFDSAPLMSV